MLLSLLRIGVVETLVSALPVVAKKLTQTLFEVYGPLREFDGGHAIVLCALNFNQVIFVSSTLSYSILSMTMTTVVHPSEEVNYGGQRTRQREGRHHGAVPQDSPERQAPIRNIQLQELLISSEVEQRNHVLYEEESAGGCEDQEA